MENLLTVVRRSGKALGVRANGFRSYEMAASGRKARCIACRRPETHIKRARQLSSFLEAALHFLRQIRSSERTSDWDEHSAALVPLPSSIKRVFDPGEPLHAIPTICSFASHLPIHVLDPAGHDALRYRIRRVALSPFGP